MPGSSSSSVRLTVGDHVQTSAGLQGVVSAIFDSKVRVTFSVGSFDTTIAFNAQELIKIEPPRVPPQIAELDLQIAKVESQLFTGILPDQQLIDVAKKLAALQGARQDARSRYGGDDKSHTRPRTIEVKSEK